jgi:hypothetical protein
MQTFDVNNLRNENFGALAFKSIKPPIRMANGKYSPTQFLKSIEEDNKWLLEYILYTEANKRSSYVDADDIGMCGLTPYWLAPANKVFDIYYEEWDKTDDNIKYLLGSMMLYNSLKKYRSDPSVVSKYRSIAQDPVKREAARVNPKTEEVKPYTSYIWFPLHESAIAYTELQFWHAHHSHRRSRMILDITDWDNRPDILPDMDSVTSLTYFRENGGDKIFKPTNKSPKKKVSFVGDF